MINPAVIFVFAMLHIVTCAPKNNTKELFYYGDPTTLMGRKIAGNLSNKLNKRADKLMEEKLGGCCPNSNPPVDETVYNHLIVQNNSLLQMINRVSNVLLYASPREVNADSVQNFISCLNYTEKEVAKNILGSKNDKLDFYFQQILNFDKYVNTLVIKDIEVEVKVLDSLTGKELMGFDVDSWPKYLTKIDHFSPTTNAKRQISPGDRMFRVKKGFLLKEVERPIDANDPNTWIVPIYCRQ